MQNIGDIIETVETTYNPDHSIKTVSTCKSKLVWGLISNENITLVTSICKDDIVERLEHFQGSRIEKIQMAYYGNLSETFDQSKPKGI